MIKNGIKIFLSKTVLTLLNNKLGIFLSNELLKLFINQNITVFHKGFSFNFATPNPITKWRVQTFSNKEPDTLTWIDDMEKNSCLWDIGANIGLYSIYAAKTRKSNVYAIEPSVFNLEILIRNIKKSLKIY